MVLRVGDVAFGIAVACIAGVLAASLAWNIVVITVVLSMAVFLFLMFFYCTMFRISCGVTAAILAVFLFGAFYFHVAANRRVAMLRLPDEKSSFSVLVVNEPVASEKYLSFSAKLQSPFRGNIKVFASPESEIGYGDLVDVSGTFVSPDEGGMPLFFPKKISVISGKHGSWVMLKLFELKRSIVRNFSRVLSGDEAALLGGLTLGGTFGMSAVLKGEMSTSETLYVTSMYGYKIAMIGVIVGGAFGGIVPRRWWSTAVIAVIVLFVLMSGMNVSALRAAIMAVMVFIAEESGNIFSRRNALTFTAAGMIIFDPSMIAQAGFLFSFASLVGIYCLDAPLRKFLRIGEGNGFLEWKSAVVLSVASLLPLIPLISATFGSFSLTAVVANILISPVIPVAFFCGLALMVGGLLSSCTAFFIAPLVRAVLVYPFSVIHFFAVHTILLPFQFSALPAFIFYYVLLGFFAYAYRDEGVWDFEKQ